ncbi:hypothetical protein SESBI_29253 [Sesbania bispinosa]|nr:hypothetical protein SESBI_29253 [Sesbania bispinosa]
MSHDVVMEPKPPDLISFRDKLVGSQSSSMHQEKIDLIGTSCSKLNWRKAIDSSLNVLLRILSLIS